MKTVLKIRSENLPKDFKIETTEFPIIQVDEVQYFLYENRETKQYSKTKQRLFIQQQRHRRSV